MAISIVKENAEREVKVGAETKKVSYSYNKIVTPAAKRLSDEAKKAFGDKAENASFPTLAELAAAYAGKVEFQKDKDGKVDGEVSCLVSDAIVGKNMRENQESFDKAVNTPAVAKVKALNEAKAMLPMLVKAGMDTSILKTQIDALEKAIAAGN